MPRIRRRTLSHNEIENFLSEISAVENQDGPIKPGSIKNEQSLTDEEEDTVVTEEICNEIKDEAQHIRDFCKITMRQKPDSKAMESLVELGKSIFEMSAYKIVTSRLMFPDEFLHPPTSMEAKKSLLISLSPMLTEAEEQRKKDTHDLEEFTRCRSSKGRGRSNYEYNDIDTATRVDFADFERRYMMFIRRNKKPIVKEEDMDISADMMESLNQSVNKDVDDNNNDNNIVQENKENEDILNVSDDFMNDTSFERKTGDRKRKHASVDRRGTLSPASARAMLLNACEEEQEAQQLLEQQQQQQNQQQMETDAEAVEQEASSSDNLVMDDEDDLLEFDDNVDFSKTSKHQIYSNRRNTLSPSSAKSLAFEIINEEEEKQTDEAVVSENDAHNDVNEDNFIMTTITTDEAVITEEIAVEIVESSVPMERSETPIVEEIAVVEVNQEVVVIEDNKESVIEEEIVSESMTDYESISSQSTVPLEDIQEEALTPPMEVKTEVEEPLITFDFDEIQPQEVTVQLTESPATEAVVKPVEELVSQLDEILESSDEELVEGEKDEECDQLEEVLESTSQIDEQEHEQVTNLHVHAVFAPSVPTATPKKCCFSPEHTRSAPSSSSSARKHINDQPTEIEESDLILLSETAILKEMHKSPCPKFSAFFGRKSEIADILKVAMDIFEENESELEVFQQLEMMVEQAYAEKQSSLPQSLLDTKMSDNMDMALIDVKSYEEVAQKRLKERIAVAHFKFQWEMVSVHAANVAIQKYHNLKK